MSESVATTQSVIQYKWTKLLPVGAPPMARSSHDISRIGSHCYLWGGEHQARTPIDSTLYTYQVSDSVCEGVSDEARECKWEAVQCSADSPPPPSPRIAHSQAVIGTKLYIFGGRAGVTMNEQPFNDIHFFDTLTGCWSGPLSTSGTAPSPRSFHKVASISNILYVFGGCGEQGRLADLYSLDVNTLVWTALSTCERESIKGRGGPSFAVVDSGKHLMVTTGFSGQENNDIYLYHVETNEWTVVSSTREGSEDNCNYFCPRSVCPSFTLQNGNFMFLFGGEVSTSDRGHEGAGDFAADVVALQCESSETNVERGLVRLVPTVNCSEEGACPVARGWTSMTTISGGERDFGEATACGGHFLGKAVLFGGLSGDDVTPLRLDDTWLLTLQLVPSS